MEEIRIMGRIRNRMTIVHHYDLEEITEVRETP